MQECNEVGHKWAWASSEFWEENTAAQMWQPVIEYVSNSQYFAFRNRSLLAHPGKQKRILGCQVKEQSQSPSFLSEQNLNFPKERHLTHWEGHAQSLGHLCRPIFYSALERLAAACPFRQERKNKKVDTAAITAVTTREGDVENSKWDK